MQKQVLLVACIEKKSGAKTSHGMQLNSTRGTVLAPRKEKKQLFCLHIALLIYMYSWECTKRRFIPKEDLVVFCMFSFGIYRPVIAAHNSSEASGLRVERGIPCEGIPW